MIPIMLWYTLTYSLSCKNSFPPGQDQHVYHSHDWSEPRPPFTSQHLELLALWKASHTIAVCDLADTQKTEWSLWQVGCYGHVITRNLISASVDTAAAIVRVLPELHGNLAGMTLRTYDQQADLPNTVSSK